jgi:hypothetical protein
LQGVSRPATPAGRRDHWGRQKPAHVEVRKLFDIVRDDVWTSTRHGQQPFTYGSPPGRDDFYFAGQ